MPRKLQITLRVAGLALIALAACFTIGNAGTIETEEHANAEGGFVIQHRIQITHMTCAVGLAGAVLFGLSFIRTQRKT